MRSEIQALRGIAVALVVVAHLWPSALPGGFVGVDVFFVISGFLITGHLLREERISLAAFWARRARRILPAALFVLAVCAVATLAIVPETRWPQFLAEIRASARLRAELAAGRERGRLLRLRGRALARPALLVAVGRGAVLPRLAGRAARRPPAARRSRSRWP